MKKNYFMLAAATMMLAACAETELVNEVNVESTPQAIGFETFANKATRATENSNAATTWDLVDHHTDFNVWASKEITAGNYVEVWASPGTAELVSGSWTPTPKKYWDKAALNYYFYAAAPADMGWIYLNETPGDGSTGFLKLNTYTLEGTANDNLATNTADDHDSWKGTSGNDVDLMIAEECSKDRDSYKSAAPTNVALVFDHILSRLNILVKKTGDATIVVKALDVCRLNDSGAFNENGATINPAVGSYGRWTPTLSTPTYKLSMYGAPLTLSSTAVYTHEYLVIPQAQQNTEETVNQGVAPATDAYIYINYTVDGEEYHTYYGLAQVFGVAKNSNLAFNEGWQNTLTINIAPDEILFDANVALWADSTPGSEDIE